ncbi:MAG TPA: M4 family metallopeptidase [Catenuloplanes sp.]|jgi:Zn-dependent metalloprotease
MPNNRRRSLAVAGACAVLVAAGVAVHVTGGSPTARAQTAPVAAPAAAPAGSSGPPAAAGPRSPAGGRTGTGTGGPTGVAAARSARTAPTPPKPSRDKAVADARAAVGRNGAVIRAAKGETYQARGVLVDPDGARHVRFDRSYRGLPVLGGDYVIHANPDGSLRQATVAQGQPITVGTKPVVDADAAAATARREFGVGHRKATPKLVVDAGRGAPVLAWRVLVEGTGPDGRARARAVVIDATTGTVRRSFDEIHTAEAGTGRGLHVGEVPLSTTKRADGSFEMIDPARGGGQTRDALDDKKADPQKSAAFTDADNAWGTGEAGDRATAAVDVHYGVAQTWDYFKRVHGRDGIRDDGKGALALVHLPEANAGWYYDCFCMKFGDGDDETEAWTALEIVAHEMSHGITRATADLEYSGESGGLNEATSDIFGTLVEFAVNNPADPPDYLIAEQIYKADGGALRYQDDPARDGRSASCWTPDVGTADVHHSSGVGNKFFYTLAVGSGKSAWGNSPTCAGAPDVAGIGNDKAGRIWYRALTAYLLSNSNYAAARLGTLQAAVDLFGAGSTEYTAVDAAWKAVNVDGSSPVPDAPGVSSPGKQYGAVGDVVSLQIKARDAQGDAFTFTAEDLPAGLSISESGLITGTLATAGWEYVTVSATDAAGHVGSTKFFWDVAGPPVVKNPGNQAHEPGSWAFVMIDATDGNGLDLTFTATGLPDGLLLYPDAKFVAGVPTKAGTWQTSITVTNSDNLSTTVSFEWTIGPAAPGGPPTARAPRRSTD